MIESIAEKTLGENEFTIRIDSAIYAHMHMHTASGNEIVRLQEARTAQKKK